MLMETLGVALLSFTIAGYAALDVVSDTSPDLGRSRISGMPPSCWGVSKLSLRLPKDSPPPDVMLHE